MDNIGDAHGFIVKNILLVTMFFFYQFNSESQFKIEIDNSREEKKSIFVQKNRVSVFPEMFA